MRILVILVYWLLPFATSAQSLPAVQLIPNSDSADLRDSVRYMTVPRDFVIPPDITELHLNGLKPIAHPDIEFGAPNLPVLVILKVRNVGMEPGTWTFSTDRASLRRIELFQGMNGSLQMELRQGDIVEQKRQLRRHHAFAFDFSLLPGEERVLGLVFEAEYSSRMPLTIMTPANSQQRISDYANLLLVVSTATLTLVLINGLLFLLTRRKAFLYFVIAEIALLYHTVHVHGYTTIYLFSEYANLGRVLGSVAMTLFAGFSIRFAREFLRLKVMWPALDKCAVAFELSCWAIIAGLVLHPFIPGLTLRAVGTLALCMGVLSTLILPVIAAWAVRKYGRIYLPLVISWGVFGAFMLFTLLAALNLVPGLEDHWRWLGPVGLLEAFFLTVALCLDIRQIQNREIQAQNRLAAELRERVQLLEASSRITNQRDQALQELIDTDQLVSAAGHDSRNFVSALKIYSYQMSKAKDLPSVHSYSQRMTQIIDHLDHTISLTMENSKGADIDEGLLCIETVNTRAFIHSLTLMYQQIARESNVVLVSRAVDHDFACDRHVLTRVLGNLIGNAIKYASNGRVLISARKFRGGVKFQVWDQGPGIPPDKLRSLLDPDHSRQRHNPDIEGSGNGLSICHGLCARIGTSLSATSQEKHGTVFDVLIKLDRTFDSQPTTVAIVDETHHWPQELLNDWRLARVGFSFYPSIREAQKRNPDIILLDPSYSSMEEQHEGASPLIVCSYDQSVAFRQRWSNLTHIILQKPVTAAALVAALTLSTGAHRVDSIQNTNH